MSSRETTSRRDFEASPPAQSRPQAVLSRRDDIQEQSRSDANEEDTTGTRIYRSLASDGSEYEESESGVSSSGEYETDAEPQADPAPPPRKRPAHSSLGFDETRPLKRSKGRFNHEYLNLLNADIEDAAARSVLGTWPELAESQIGLTTWTPAEKDMLFEALSKLGRDDVRGIASRIGTKGELEVRQYLHMLHDALIARKESNDIAPASLDDFPAATELGVQCCHALDEAADAVAVRQENYEESQQKRQWGDNWLVTPFNYQRVEEQAQHMHISSTELFRVENWLRLSERLFMNSSLEENNWQAVGDRPSIRLTALEDFHSLAVSLTKRLVAAVIYMSRSRVRSKKQIMPWTRNLVRKADVDAATASLGLKTHKRMFLAGCPRRLRIDVYEDVPRDDDDGEQEPLSYNEVETLLGVQADDRRDQSDPSSRGSSEDDESMASDSSLCLEDLTHPEPVESGNKAAGPLEAEPEWDSDVAREAIEAIQYSAMGFPETTRARRALLWRIEAERQGEDYAEMVDRKAGILEEKRMWTLLEREPPDLVFKFEEMAKPNLRGTVEGIHPVGNEWRRSLHYLSEWEVADEVCATTSKEAAGPKEERRNDTPRKIERRPSIIRPTKDEADEGSEW